MAFISARFNNMSKRQAPLKDEVDGSLLKRVRKLADIHLSTEQLGNALSVALLARLAFGPDLPKTKVEWIDKIRSADRKKHSRLFECIMAFRSGLLLWENLPCDVLEAIDWPRFKTGFRDMGQDAASPDLKVAQQGKWYEEGRTVGWRCASTFYCSTVLTVLFFVVLFIVGIAAESDQCNYGHEPRREIDRSGAKVAGHEPCYDFRR